MSSSWSGKERRVIQGKKAHEEMQIHIKNITYLRDFEVKIYKT